MVILFAFITVQSICHRAFSAILADLNALEWRFSQGKGGGRREEKEGGRTVLHFGTDLNTYFWSPCGLEAKSKNVRFLHFFLSSILRLPSSHSSPDFRLKQIEKNLYGSLLAIVYSSSNY